jgi:hypothetical protein
MKNSVDMQQADPFDFEERERELLMQASILQASMEGVLRQLYQACQQQALVQHVRHYGRMLDSAVGYFNSLQEVLVEYEDSKNKQRMDRTSDSNSLM